MFASLFNILWLGFAVQLSGFAIDRYHHLGAQPLVTVRNGSYLGIHSRNLSQDQFLGIPFAQPPVNDLRFRLPVSLNTTWDSPRNATSYGHACIGYGEDTYIGANNYTSEDCLSLNVVRPSGYEHCKLPVGVWIYGGGFFEGSSIDPRYNLSYIVQQSVEIGKPFIAVSINYRLHGWGFLFSEDVLKAGVTNLGLRDQRLALHWIQENINSFGGDQSKVTIWGESAGALSVGLQMLAYDGRDDRLFSGAIAESGALSGVGLLNPTIELAEKLYQNIILEAGCSDATDRLACLRLLSTSDLNNILQPITGEDYYQVYFGPLVDKDFIARGVIEQVLNGSFVKVPYMLGQNSDDGTDFSPFGINNDSDFVNFYSGFYFDNQTLSKIMSLYPNDSPSDIPQSFPGEFNETIGLQFKRSSTLIGDIAFKAPTRLSSQEWNKHTNISLYNFRFNAISNGIPDYFGATHGLEVPFVFYNIEGQGFPDASPPYFGPDPFKNRPQSFFNLAKLMSRTWASFIHDGNPNFNSSATYWPPYTSESPTTFVFDANVTSYVEQDIVREAGIGYLIEKYQRGAGPWGRA